MWHRHLQRKKAQVRKTIYMRTSEALTRLENEFLRDKQGKEIGEGNEYKRSRVATARDPKKSQSRRQGPPPGLVKGLYRDGAMGSDH